MDDVLFVVLLILAGFLLLVALIMVPLSVSNKVGQNDCVELGEETGRMTHWEQGCWIEIQPGLSVRERDLPLYLDHVMPVEGE